MFFYGFILSIGLLVPAIGLLSVLETKENICVAMVSFVFILVSLKIFSWSINREHKCESLFFQATEFRLQNDDRSAEVIERTRTRLGC